MSHVVSIKTEIKDLQAIANACQRLGWTFKQGQTTYRWVGNWYDDSPLPRELFETEEEYQRVLAMTKPERCAYMNARLGKCQHAIGLPNAKGEIGLLQRGNQFIPIWDYYTDIGINKVRVDNGMAGFVQAYAVEAAKLQAQRQGHTCQEHVLQDGTIKLVVTEGY
jgi:hypothetical protein